MRGGLPNGGTFYPEAMDVRDVARLRLRGQRLVGEPLADPVAVVRHLGAMQSQEFPYALWSIAQRTSGDLALGDVRKFVDDGAIVRTHALRPTWHFLAPEDLGWIQALTGPRVHVFNGYYYRKFGIDARSAARTNAVITDAVRGGAHKTRKELSDLLGATGIALAYLIMYAELEGLIVNGPMRGKQHTYALAEERIAAPRQLTGDEALAELSWRYFSSHGPATVKDFGWWSSLTVAQIKRGLSILGDRLTSAEIEGLTLWYDPALEPFSGPPVAHLLQTYDEYVVAYSNTKFATNLAGITADPQRYTDNTLFHAILVDGQLAGFWRSPAGKREIDLISALTPAQHEALDAELTRHSRSTSAHIQP